MDHAPESTAARPSPRAHPRTAYPELDQSLRELQAAKHEWATVDIIEKICLIEAATRRLGEQAGAWVQAAARGKGIPPQSPWVGEEWLSGPWAVATALNGYRRTLDRLEEHRLPEIKKARTTANGRLAVRVFPATLNDRLILSGVTAEVWMQQGVTRENLADHMASFYKQERPTGKVALVLGAGNITAIAPLDTMHRLLVRGHVVIVKLSPLLDHLGPMLEEVFEPFVRRGFLRFAYGSGDVGSYLAYHDDVDEIHITGSFDTYDKLVYGAGPEGEARKRRGERILHTPITAELGGAGPVIVIPGAWSAADIRFQAENIVTMKMQNAGFNCVAAQVLVVPRAWPQREQFMQAIRDVMRALPERHAYYPGAATRLAEIRARHRQVEVFAGEVPPAILPDLDPEGDQYAFTTEMFGPVLAETALPGDDAATFFANAVAFCNEKLLGNLGANILVHPRTRRELGDKFETILADLRYGAIGVNVWNAAAFLLAQATWGAYPEPGRKHRASGDAVVRNALMFDRPERTVSYGAFHPFPRSLAHGKFTVLPKPPWFVTNKTAAKTTEQIVKFTVTPHYRDLPKLLVTALRG